MENLRIYMIHVNGDRLDYTEDSNTGKNIIEGFCGNDFELPPQVFCVEAETEDGKTVHISIPYDDSIKAKVRIN